MIAARDVIQISPREGAAAVGAIVLETFERAGAVAPQHEIAPERLHRMRRPGLTCTDFATAYH